MLRNLDFMLHTILTWAYGVAVQFLHIYVTLTPIPQVVAGTNVVFFLERKPKQCVQVKIFVPLSKPPKEPTPEVTGGCMMEKKCPPKNRNCSNIKKKN